MTDLQKETILKFAKNYAQNAKDHSEPNLLQPGIEVQYVYHFLGRIRGMIDTLLLLNEDEIANEISSKFLPIASEAYQKALNN